MSFEDAIALLPVWVLYWINFIVAVPMVSVIIFLFSKATGFDALVTLPLTASAFGTTALLYSQFGMIRLFGLGHFIFWTPLVIYLAKRLRNNPPPQFFVAVMAILRQPSLPRSFLTITMSCAGSLGSGTPSSELWDKS